MRIKVFFISAIVALGAFTSCRESAVEMEDPAVEVVSELRRVNRLSLAEMSINKVGTISDSGATGFASLLNMLKVGDRIGVYSYHTYLEAYMDLDALDAADLEVYQDRRLVKLRLPAIQVRLSGRDATVTEEHYRVTGMRSTISPVERAQLKELMNTTLRQELKSTDEYGERLRANAREKAVGYFSALLQMMGYDSEITFK